MYLQRHAFPFSLDPSVKIFLITRKFSDIILCSTYVGFYVMCLFLLHFNRTSIFSTTFRKNSQKFSRKSVHWEPLCCMGKETRTKEPEETDSTELTVCFRNFANAHKNGVGGNSLVFCWSSVPEGTDNKQDKYQS